MADLAVALVDYDNVKIQEERNAGDVDINLAALVPIIVSEAEKALDQPKELLIRVYGGWIDEQGQHSLRAQWLLVGLGWYRGRSGGTIVKPTLVTSLACRTSDTLIGTVRKSLSGGTRQKMVDNLIAVDAQYLSRDRNLPIVVFSDDDDLVPAALAASSMAAALRLHWLRRRKVGSGMNDALLRRAGITFGSI
jgi:hypothetical protein